MDKYSCILNKLIFSYRCLACRYSILSFLFLTLSNFGFAQFIEPAPIDTTNFGIQVQRTMKLLASSTPTKRNTVKIMVYGQSISKQEWWMDVRDDLKKRFPNANIVMENRSLGGFASSLLVKPLESDVMAFYPDLVLFHVYISDQSTYRAILDSIRSRTSAEVALQNNHYAGGTEGDNDSYVVAPDIARNLKLEMMNIRTPWIEYLKVNNYQADRLLADAIHLNDTGSFLLSSLILRHLAYKPKYASDPNGLVTTYEVGKDVSFINGKLNLSFDGNKVDLIPDNLSPSTTTASVLLDGKKPSTFHQAYYFTRANDSTHVNGYYERDPENKEIRMDWPWMTGTILRIVPQTTTLEDWDLTVTNYTYDGTNAKFNFSLRGSVTGEDGSGQVTLSRNGWTSTMGNFKSRSGKVSFNHNDWWLPQSIEGNYPYKGTKYAPKITFPFHIKWKVIPRFSDTFQAPVVKDNTLENSITVVQGISNGTHTLELTSDGNGAVPLKAIKVYRPFSRRLKSTLNTIDFISEQAITVYPNPASNFLKVSLPETNENVEIEVVSLLGKHVKSFDKSDSSDTLTLDLVDIDAGIYLLNIKVGEQLITRKFNVAR